MKTKLVGMAMAVSLLWIPLAAYAQSGQSTGQVPPVAQPLVREGDFAMKLVEGLRLGTAENEAQAESMLTSVGIAPRNGWVADYPVTPDIMGELQNGIGVAADTGRLAMSRDDAFGAWQEVTAGEGLSIEPAAQATGTGNESQVDYGQYADAETLSDYYSDEGPPVVTYYPPPPDYDYLYGWVPWPFWWADVWFPGFFVLNDFDRFVRDRDHDHDDGHHHGMKEVSNHMRDPKTNTFGRIDPAKRATGNGLEMASHSGTKGFGSAAAKNGAASIFNHSVQRVASGKGIAGVGTRTSRGQFLGNAGAKGLNSAGGGARSFHSPFMDSKGGSTRGGSTMGGLASGHNSASLSAGPMGGSWGARTGGLSSGHMGGFGGFSGGHVGGFSGGFGGGHGGGGGGFGGGHGGGGGHR